MKNNLSRKSRSLTLSDKIRSSMALKLNFKMLIGLFFAFMAINLLLFFISAGIIIWQAESKAVDILNNDELLEISTRGEEILGYQIEITDRELDFLVLPDFIQSWLPVSGYINGRSLNSSSLRGPVSGLPVEQIEAINYKIAIPVESGYQLISYSIGHDLKLLIYLILMLLFCQLLYILGRIRKNNRMIRETLKPLSDMAEKAKKLQSEIADLSSRNPNETIKDLAGAISSIDAEKLDYQLSVDGSQDELKSLAHAINDMLRRINQAYQSQIRFVSDASHELRTPISVIQGYAGMIDRWGKHDEKTLQEAIDAIKSETENMKMLVEHLLFLARGDNEAIQLNKIRFDCSDLIEEIISETQIIDQDHKIITELEKPAFIEADEQLLKQAVRILVDNSLKYTEPGQEVKLKAFSKDDEIVIQVQDNGIGIAPEDLPNIFERFYRSDESRARKTGGTGLGLAIAKWIIERHGGHFEVLSRQNIGTRINVILPIN
ncbi:HAMP domain-containing protein [Halanaerobiaceae bacterium Z-7014]|uniref:histidine kinase n=1 Tax=Halonatronomonas betaini TaxID=2778430 RepID=A0A931F779_9FIRM|nr:HAMP domain-containing sensor histidine kinase [Halonatronomonas betaini]MBF8436361.1 HAMP domain-containing protein [Halonatronomonas betaini]